MILAVTGGKGGVGKSTVAYNLGAQLDAVVVDADLGMADLPESRGPDLHDVLAGRASAVEAIRETGPVTMLPCGRSLTGARAADPVALVETVEAVARQYGHVVIDTPAGLRSDAGLPVFAAEGCVLVTRPTRPALADAIRTRELARAVETPLVRVALNRVDPEHVNQQTERAVQLADTLGGPVTKIPESDQLERAQQAGKPIQQVAPDSLPAAQIERLAEAVRTCATV
ncbi:MinD/ParA family ATP-binding protein [Halovenus marina]|uniref:MinD/ParA family ATP-binding protein n=1 Tax=Halovenus marina TaxID=3396621 RepID=UPI003F57379F